MVEALSWAAYLEEKKYMIMRESEMIIQVNILEGKLTKLAVQETQVWRQSLV